jgi:hypothetical protein
LQGGSIAERQWIDRAALAMLKGARSSGAPLDPLAEPGET